MSKIFKVSAMGDVLYIDANTVEEAKDRLCQFCGPVPDYLLSWSVVPELPEGEELLP